MPNDELPDPEEVIEDLRTFIPIAYGAIEAGTTVARAFFEGQRADCESFLFSDMVRWAAKRHFERDRLRAELEIVDLANNGLLVGHKDYGIRVRKRYNGGVAVPGTFTMEQFHAQTLRLVPNTGRPNVFVLWDVYKPSFALAPDLYIACPKTNTAKFPDVASLHWLWKLPNVALLPGKPVEAEGFDDYEDLPIRRPGNAPTGSEDQ
jgi:hypothetical protein